MELLLAAFGVAFLIEVAKEFTTISSRVELLLIVGLAFGAVIWIGDIDKAYPVVQDALSVMFLATVARAGYRLVRAGADALEISNLLRRASALTYTPHPEPPVGGTLVVKKRTTKKKKSVTIGVMGSATTTVKAAKSLIDDFVAARDGANVSFILPITKDLFTPGVKIVADYVTDNDIVYQVVTDEAGVKSRNFKPYLNNAEQVHAMKRGIPQKVVGLLTGDEKFLFALYDEKNEDDSLEKAVEKAFSVGDIEVRDLAGGLGVLEGDEEEEDDEDDEESEDEEGDDEEEVPEDAEDDDDDADDTDDDEEEDEPVTKKRAAKSSKPPAKAEDNGYGETAGVLIALGQALISVGESL